MEGPLISVISPVGPRHVDHIHVAHASLIDQTIPRHWWEHVVVYDRAGRGPAVCRNVGLARARGAFVVFLDADDYLLPTALETYLRGHAASQAAYHYADNVVVTPNQELVISTSQEYLQAKQAHFNIHVVTALVPTRLARAVGGFDEGVDAWEDWTLWLRMAIAGMCGERIPAPTLAYRYSEGDRMVRFLADREGNAARMRAVTDRYQREGVIHMGCCGQSDPEARIVAQVAVQNLGAAAPSGDGLVRLQYTGPQQGSFILRSPTTGQSYKVAQGRLIDAHPADVAWLESFGTFQRVVVAVLTEAPAPATVAAFPATMDAVTPVVTDSVVVLTSEPVDPAPVEATDATAEPSTTTRRRSK